MKLNVKAFSPACVVFWGDGMVLLTWWLMAFEGTNSDPGIIGRFHRGYQVSLWGSLVGLIWGLVDGLLCGTVLAWLYNRIARKLTTEPGLPEKGPIAP